MQRASEAGGPTRQSECVVRLVRGPLMVHIQGSPLHLFKNDSSIHELLCWRRGAVKYRYGEVDSAGADRRSEAKRKVGCVCAHYRGAAGIRYRYRKIRRKQKEVRVLMYGRPDGRALYSGTVLRRFESHHRHFSPRLFAPQRLSAASANEALNAQAMRILGS